MSITVGSRIQVAPLVCWSRPCSSSSPTHGEADGSRFRKPAGVDAIAGVTFALNAIATDGEKTWFEGVLLRASYLILAMVFFFVET